MNLPTALLVLAELALLGTIMMMFTAIQRGRRAQRRLTEEGHARALALDRRCDALQAQLDQVHLDRQVAHVATLTARAAASRTLSPDAATRLTDAVFELQRDASRR